MGRFQLALAIEAAHIAGQEHFEQGRAQIAHRLLLAGEDATAGAARAQQGNFQRLQVIFEFQFTKGNTQGSAGLACRGAHHGQAVACFAANANL